MADVGVRALGPADKAAWRGLWGGYQQHFGGCVPEDVCDRTWAQLLDETVPLHGLLAEVNAKPCGLVHYSITPFAWTASPVCFLQDLFVEEGGRGSGAGRALVQAVYQRAEAAGASNVFWLADMADERLCRFYATIAVQTPYVRFMQKPWNW